MKRHISSIVFGCVGLCVGFTLCYVYVVLPKGDPKAASPQRVAVSANARGTLDWQPYVIQPMIPPRVVGQ